MTKTIKMTERTYDKDGKLVKEVITETTEPVNDAYEPGTPIISPYYWPYWYYQPPSVSWTWTSTDIPCF